MKPKKNLPPELQTLVDKYNTLLEEYGFNMPYMDTGFENYDFEGKASYSSPDEEASDNDWGFKADAAWRDSKVSPEEWNSRVDKINDLYNNIIEKAVKYSNAGKIEFLPEDNKEDSPTHAYDRVFEPSTGRTVWLSHQASPLPRFRSTGRDDVSPMKSKVAGERAEVERPGLQKPRPMDLPSLKKELIMRTNPNMRTGQEPNYYVVKDGNRKRVQPVEQEELDYYREKNKVKKPAYGGKYSFEEGGRFKAVKKAEKGMRVKKANQGMVVGDPTPDTSGQMQKASDAMNFLKLLYGDKHVRGIINRNLRYDGRNNFRADTNNPGEYIQYTPQMWLQEEGSNIDVNQDVPAFATPALSDFIKVREGGVENTPNIKDFRDPHDFVPGFDNDTQRLAGHLRMMFPEREQSLMTFKGLSDTYADMMGDFSASMGNMRFDDSGEGSSGYVQRQRNRTGVRPNDMYDFPGEHEYSKGKSIYNARQDKLGFKSKPYIMGMGKYQNRMNEAIQVDPDQDTSVFIHEMTHAGDIESNSFNEQYIDAISYDAKVDGSEQNKMLKDRSRDYGSSPQEWFSYVTKPTETLARLNQLRYAMYKHFGSEDSPYKQEDFVNYTYGNNPRKEVNIFKNDKSSRAAYDDLRSVYGEDVIMDMLNNLY